MRAIFGILLLAVLVPILYVGSAVVYFPAIVWHAVQEPRSSALMRLRAAQAAAEDRAWSPRYEWVPLESISPHLGRAVLAAEDTRFYEHAGFDLEQIRSAWEANRSAGRTLRGASTITQQTVKNLYLSPSRNVLRKAREALLTAWMELWLPKDRILELYLNVVELGPGVFGAEAASRAYYGRSAANLTREQAAFLAATLPAPLVRNPGAPTAGLRRRQRMILSRMNRWYEGPSLAAQEATGEIEIDPAVAEEVEGSAPELREAQPIDIAPVEPPGSDTVEPPGSEPIEEPEGAPVGAPSADTIVAPESASADRETANP